MSRAVTVKNGPTGKQWRGDGPWRKGLLIQITMNFYPNNLSVSGHAIFFINVMADATFLFNPQMQINPILIFAGLFFVFHMGSQGDACLTQKHSWRRSLCELAFTLFQIAWIILHYSIWDPAVFTLGVSTRSFIPTLSSQIPLHLLYLTHILPLMAFSGLYDRVQVVCSVLQLWAP